jgi:putative ABC transport system permease protein
MLIQNSDGGTDVGQPYVATAALLAHYKIAPSDLTPGAVLLTSRVGLSKAAALQLPFTCSFSNHCPATSCIANPKIQTLTGLPTGTAEPNLLLSTSAMQRYELHASTAGWLIQAPHPLSATQINAARQRASAAGLTIETKNDSPSLSELDAWATAAGILLALGVLAMTVGLIRSETAGDLKVLTAAGASRRIRRTLTAVTAGALGLLGAFIGTAVAYLAAIAYFHNQLDERLGHVPVVDLAMILIGLPTIAVVGGWLLSGREPSAIARQPIE